MDEKSLKERFDEKYFALKDKAKLDPNLSEPEKQLLATLTVFPFVSYRSASENSELENQVYGALVYLLNLDKKENSYLTQLQTLFEESKIRDRENMSLSNKEKAFVTVLAGLASSYLVFAGLILGLTLLWPAAVVMGVTSLIFTLSAVWFFTERQSELDKRVNDAWTVGHLESFISTITDEHQQLLIRLNVAANISGTDPNAIAQKKREEEEKCNDDSSDPHNNWIQKNQPPKSKDNTTIQTTKTFFQDSNTQTSTENGHSNRNPICNLF